MRYPALPLRLLLVLVLFVAAGCSKSNPDAPPLRDGQHPANWVQVHGLSYLDNAGRCTPCHGDPRDPSSTGGIAQVSCSRASFNGTTCHAGGPFGHPTGFAAPAVHGATAKSQPVGAQGFDFCSKCHGSTFGGMSALGSPACGSCHGIDAPHPQTWIIASSTNPYTHTTTQVDNAVVCFRCHSNGQNSPIPPPSPPGTGAPGCFNNTLCHGVVAGHPSGWADPSQHGAAAKSTPSAEDGFMGCRSCHGSDFTGGSAGVSCFSCHTTAPHAPSPWSGAPYTHTTTDTGNAVACDLCHHNNNSSPAPAGTPAGCFNNTLCHGNQASHPLPTWLQHNQASGIPSACTPCHGSNLQGASGPACSTCHFNVAVINVANPSPTDCTSCHSAPPDGTSFPNIAGAHAVHLGLPASLTCTDCHDGYGTGTQSHYDNSRNKLDHPGSVGIDTPWADLTGTPSFNTSTFTCANVRCHGGQTTPNWRTGSLDITASTCTSCHTASGSYISFTGGPEGHHRGITGCTSCHSLTKLSTLHFSQLSRGTTSMGTVPGQTVGGSGTIVTYNPSTKSCTPTCHGTKTWSGGG